MPDEAQPHEPSLREQLMADYEQHEHRIEDAATVELWALGDWLAMYVPPRHPGPAGVTDPQAPISLEDLAERGHRSVRQLRRLRKLALATEADRLPQIAPRTYEEVLRRVEWDLMKANHLLVTKGHRLKDHSGPMRSMDELRSELDKRPPEQRAEMVRDLSEDPTVRELLGDEPAPDLGAAWADKWVIRLDEQAHKFTSLVKREGLVFSPDSDLTWFLEALERTEGRIAEIRAAVQERIRDARLAEEEVS